MAKNNQQKDSNKELVDLTKKLIALELFNSGVAKEEIRKKLHMDANELSRFLKGVKKSN